MRQILYIIFLFLVMANAGIWTDKYKDTLQRAKQTVAQGVKKTWNKLTFKRSNNDEKEDRWINDYEDRHPHAYRDNNNEYGSPEHKRQVYIKRGKNKDGSDHYDTFDEDSPTLSEKWRSFKEKTREKWHDTKERLGFTSPKVRYTVYAKSTNSSPIDDDSLLDTMKETVQNGVHDLKESVDETIEFAKDYIHEERRKYLGEVTVDPGKYKQKADEESKQRYLNELFYLSDANLIYLKLIYRNEGYSKRYSNRPKL